MKIEKIELTHAGVLAMLRSQEAMEICKEFTDEAAEQLGEGFKSEGFIGPHKANAELQAVTWDAFNKNKEDNRMIKAVTIK